MYDRELAREILVQIYQAVQTVLHRFEPVRSANDFTSSHSGMEKLDAICMQLIAIGEALKNLDKMTDNTFLKQYPEIEWKKVKGMRDIISHHYFDLDAEAIFGVCKNHIPPLANTLARMIKEL
jgi:uncharacterized protein with HEPN domain